MLLMRPISLIFIIVSISTACQSISDNKSEINKQIPRTASSPAKTTAPIDAGTGLGATGWLTSQTRGATTRAETVAREIGRKTSNLGRLFEPREIAYLFVSMASPLAVAVNGHTIMANGGDSLVTPMYRSLVPR